MKLSEKFAIGAVVSVLFKFIMAGVTLKAGTKSIDFGPIDGAVVAAILTPILGAIHLETYVNKKGNPPNDNQN